MLRTKSLIVSLIFLTFATTVYADVVPGPAPKAAGDLALLIVASDSPDYITEWLKTPPRHGVKIKRLKVVQPEQLIVTSFLVTGFTPDTDGNLSLLFSFALLDPNGNEVFSQRNFARAIGKAPHNPSFIMADPALDIVLENSDPEGVYTMIGLVEDLNAKKSAKAKYTIRLNNNQV